MRSSSRGEVGSTAISVRRGKGDSDLSHHDGFPASEVFARFGKWTTSTLTQEGHSLAATPMTEVSALWVFVLPLSLSTRLFILILAVSGGQRQVITVDALPVSLYLETELR